MQARLLARVQTRHARQIVNSRDKALRVDGTVLVGIVDDDLLAYRLDALLAGRSQAAARFPVPPGSFRHGGMVLPDLSGAVFPMCGEAGGGVCLIDRDGAVRWHWRYSYSEGDVLVSADGRWVWTVVAEGADSLVSGPVSVVLLDLDGGREVARVGVPSWIDFRQDQLVAHPDGRHVAVGGAQEGEEGPYWSTVFWLRQSPHGGLELRDFPTDSEEVSGFDRSGAMVAMSDVYGEFLRLRRFDTGAVTLTVRADTAGGLARYSGFLAAGRVLASCASGAHWLLDVPEEGDEPIERTLGDAGTSQVSYPPAGPQHPLSHLWALGDGTWLTADHDVLYQWAATPS